ncbi:MAG: type II toxin-antitoxin system RelE/ParE family toxin [Chitinophagales bacterium]|nr:type II toxin-antitoxin system RelE/ParE family toxin [Chitinophagales bacterium]
MEEISIRFAQYAQFSLIEIYNYYCETTTELIASQVYSRILDAIDDLLVNPYLEINEPYAPDFKFILCYDYKIIFKRFENVILIADIFHTSQDPSKIPEHTKV